MKNAIKPIISINNPIKTGAETSLNCIATGKPVEIANAVPNLAIDNCKPIARANSLPLNHFTIILETVIPAISTPTPNIAYPIAANMTLAFQPNNSVPDREVADTAQYFMLVPIIIIIADIKPVKRTPILSRIIPPITRKKRNTLNQP